MRIVRLIFLLTFNGVVLASTFALSQNNFINKPNWTVQKANLNVPIVGADEALMGRSILSGGNAHLDDSYGYQEIRSRRELDVDKISFRFYLAKDAYIYIFYRETQDSREGVRLSANPKFRGLLFAMNGDREFLHPQALDTANLLPGWHVGSYVWQRGVLIFRCDDSEIFSAPTNLLRSSIAFQGGSSEVLVSWVEAAKDHKTVWRDDFLPNDLWRTPLKQLVCFESGLLAIFLCLSIFAKSLRNSYERSIAYASLFCLLWLCFDLFYYSHTPILAHFSLNHREFEVSNREPTFRDFDFEYLRSSLFRKWAASLNVSYFGDPRLRAQRGYEITKLEYTDCEDDTCRQVQPDLILQRPAPDGNSDTQHLVSWPPRQPKEFRLLMLGGSLYFGAGASSKEKSLFVQLSHMLKASLGDRKLHTLNISLPGNAVAQYAEILPEVVQRFQPDFLVEGFLTSIKERGDLDRIAQLLDWENARGLSALFLFRVQNPERPTTAQPDETRLKSLVNQKRIPSFDLASVTNDVDLNDRGILWWDFWHVTDFGHHLIAKKLLPVIWAQAM